MKDTKKMLEKKQQIEQVKKMVNKVMNRTLDPLSKLFLEEMECFLESFIDERRIEHLVNDPKVLENFIDDAIRILENEDHAEVNHFFRKVIKQAVQEHTKNYKNFAPKNGEKFYFITRYGHVDSEEWEDNDDNRGSLEAGNVFSTLDEAAYEAEFRKILGELRAFSRPFIAGQDNWYISCDVRQKFIYLGVSRDNSNGAYHFESKEKAVEAVRAIGEDRLLDYYFKIYGEDDFFKDHSEDDDEYPFGKCENCDYEFNSELIDEYEIKFCPNCGEKIE